MSTDSLVLTNEKTIRDYAMLFNARNYPNITPRDDADILILAHRLYEGPESAIYDYLTRHKLAEACPELSESQNVANAISTSTQVLAIPLSEVIGLKPEAIERPIPGLFTSPIPDTDYSLRIWAGPARAFMFNMDFVHTATGQPTNSPFEFKLFAVGSTLGPFPGMEEVHSGEATFARGQEILPGEEKFFLVDGGHYAIVRPGKRDVFFSVPQRLSATPPPNGDVLNFPGFI